MQPSPAERLQDLVARIALYPGGPMLGRAAVAACLALAAGTASLDWLDAAAAPAWLRHLDPVRTVADDRIPAARAQPQPQQPPGAVAAARGAGSSVHVLSTHVMADAAGEATLTLRLHRGAEPQVHLRVEGAEVEAAAGPVRRAASGVAGVELLGSGTVRLALQDLHPARALRLRLVDAHGRSLDACTGAEVAVLAVPAAAPLTVALAR